MRLATTHPTTPERFVQMQNVAAEIADKKRRQLPLLPELKVTPQTSRAKWPSRERAQLLIMRYTHFLAWQSFSNSGNGL